MVLQIIYKDRQVSIVEFTFRDIYLRHNNGFKQLLLANGNSRIF